uniref:Uncharacterized protein n=1 Tax=viral metagenome TaxID=1070528 RepID=A0A6C0HWC5_9ZZZZ
MSEPAEIELITETTELSLLKILSDLITDPTTDPVTYPIVDLENDAYDSHSSSEYEREIEHNKMSLPVHLIDLIKLNINLEREELQQKYKIELTGEILSILSLMLNADPAFFVSVENTFIEIIKGNKIDARDVPNIMALLINLYTILAELKFKPLNTQICGSVLKFIIAVIIQDKVVCIDNEMDMLLCLTLLIDSCIELTTLNNKFKKTKSRFNPFAGCFTF